jgi:hypothetical protein
MTKEKLFSALEELCSAYEDAMRRYQAGDQRALESNMLSATYNEAQKVLRLSRQDIAMGEF